MHDGLTRVKKWKLRWYGHIWRSSEMTKTILQGTVKGARRRGRQKKRWEDNMKEWTWMGFGDSLRAAEDQEGWKGIVAKSSMVPRRPPRLRDLRWDEGHIIVDYLVYQNNIADKAQIRYQKYEGCLGSSWNLVRKLSNIDIIFSFFLSIIGGH